MNAAELIPLLPGGPTREREDAIIALVANGDYLPIRWCAIRSEYQGRAAIILCASDALCLGSPSDKLRVNVTHTGAQRIADLLGLRLPTTKLADLIHREATTCITPCTQAPDSKMANTSRMYMHSRAVEVKVRSATTGGLVSTVGKDWVLTERLKGKPDKGANYGWHVAKSQYKGPGGLPVLQPLGLAHNRYHVDYSQVLRLIHPTIVLGGKYVGLDELLQDPELHGLVSDEGPLSIVRHPGVPAPASPVPPPIICGS